MPVVRKRKSDAFTAKAPAPVASLGTKAGASDSVLNYENVRLQQQQPSEDRCYEKLSPSVIAAPKNVKVQPQPTEDKHDEKLGQDFITKVSQKIVSSLAQLDAKAEGDGAKAVSPKTSIAEAEAAENKRKAGEHRKKVFYSQVCCALGTSPCSCCCVRCPPMKESTSTRLMYILMFAFTIAISLISLIDAIPNSINEVSSLNGTCLNINGEGCISFFGNHISVYKICAGQISLHLVLLLLTINTKNSAIFTGALHNGFWLWKWAWMLTTILVIFFYFKDDEHILWYVFRICGMIGGCLFIVVNIFFMCDVALGFNKTLLERAAINGKVYILIVALTLLILMIAGFFIWLLYAYYRYCYENYALMLASMSACGFLLVATIISGAVKGHKNGDILQAGIVISYILYQTWRALHSKPSGDFNTEVLQNVLRGAISTTSTVSTTVMHASTDSHTPLRCRLNLGLSATSNQSITGLLRYLGLAYYVFIALHKSIDHTRKHAVTMKRYMGSGPPKHVHEHQRGCCYTCKVEHLDAGQTVLYNEEKRVLYNYSYMHFQFICSIFFIMMTFTNWFEPGNRIALSQTHQNWAAFWIEIITAWLAVIVYALILVLPGLIRLFKCRDNACCRKALTELPNVQLEALDKTYCDAEGQQITNIGTYAGILYTKDSHEELKPVRLVRKITVAGLPKKDLNNILLQNEDQTKPIDYLDKDGNAIPHIESYQGLLYVRDDSKGSLRAVRLVQPYFDDMTQDVSGKVTINHRAVSISSAVRVGSQMNQQQSYIL